MKRIIATLVVIAIIGIGGFFCSCTRIRTDKFATVDINQGSICIIERGFIAGFLTPEGPFPRWSEDLQIQLVNPSILSASTPVTLVAKKDFSTLYNKVQSGNVIIDRNKQEILINVAYTHSYLWTRINGKYRIRK